MAVAALLFVLVAPGSASATPPSNDNFANAETITDRFGWVEGDNTEATKEPGEPNHAGNPGGASVWYSWTAPSSGRATLNLCYAEFDSLLAVYVGDDVVAAPTGRGRRQRLWRTELADVHGERRCDVQDRRRRRERCAGYFELGWGIGPSNDDFAAANELPGDSGSIDGDNRYATLEPGEPEHGPYGSASVWYRWTAPSTGPATFELCDSSFDTMVAVYTGSSVDGLTRVTQDDNDCPNEYGARVSFTATAGQEYRIAVDGAYGDWGDLTLRWSRTILAPRQPRAAVDSGPPDRRRPAERDYGAVGRNPAARIRLPVAALHDEQLPADLGCERCDVPAHELRRRVSTASTRDGVERGRFPDRRVGDDGHRGAIAPGERDPTLDHGGSIPGRRPDRGRRTVERHRALVHVSVAAMPKGDLHRHR